MDNLPENLPVIGAGVVVLLLCVVVVWKIFSRNKSSEPEYMKKVRDFVSQGKFAQAATIQIKHGHKQEALNLLLRGEVHDRASMVAAELGQFDKAASSAEKAGKFERAADLYAKFEDYANAGRLYQRSGKFYEAAAAMEKDPDASLEDIAKMWENACMEMLPEDVKELGLVMDDAQKIIHCAERAAEAYKRCGNSEKAAFFFEIGQKHDAAKQMRGRATFSSMTSFSLWVIGWWRD